MMRKLKTIEMHRLTLDEFRAEQKVPLIVVLDNVRSLYNVGSVFRTCDAFRVEAVYLCGITATPPNAEIHKTALGGEDSVAWRYFATPEEAVEQLHRDGTFVYTIEQCEGSTKLQALELERGERRGERGEGRGKRGERTALTLENSEESIPQDISLSSLPSPLSPKEDTSLSSLLSPLSPNEDISLSPLLSPLSPKEDTSLSPLPSPLSPKEDTSLSSLPSPLSPKKYAIVLGNEVKGVKQTVVDMSDGCLEIPQFGTKHSLNVSVTAGIVIWEFARRLLGL